LYSLTACTKISALDFASKIRTHSLFSFQRSNISFFVDSAFRLTNSYIISCPNQLCKHFFKIFFCNIRSQYCISWPELEYIIDEISLQAFILLILENLYLLFVLLLYILPALFRIMNNQNKKRTPHPETTGKEVLYTKSFFKLYQVVIPNP
ncbi:hypothetical protein ABH894_001881, partial [Paenibacillus sp. RC62]